MKAKQVLVVMFMVGCSGAVDDQKDPSDAMADEDRINQNSGDSQGDDDVAQDDNTLGNDEIPGNNDIVGNNSAPSNNDIPGNNQTPGNNTTVEGTSLATFYEEFFPTLGCTSGYCHATFGLGSAEDVYAAFVNVEAPQPLCGRTHYVVPGEPEQSILWLRVRDIEDDDDCDIIKMPKDRTENLDPEMAGMIYDWIAGGANP